MTDQEQPKDMTTLIIIAMVMIMILLLVVVMVVVWKNTTEIQEYNRLIKEEGCQALIEQLNGRKVVPPITFDINVSNITILPT